MLLFGAAFLSGTLNSVAGGGGFISFPSLLFAGIAPIPANATSTAALWPGTVASSFAYRKEIDHETRKILLPLVCTSFLGALAGAYILLHTPASTFVKLIPWLMLIATVLFTFSDRITSWIQFRTAGEGKSPFVVIAGVVMQLVIAVYVGYFGAGAGIPILALLAVMGVKNIHAMNGMKTLLVSVANAVALGTFVWAKIVVWPQALVMIVGAFVGGYGGAHLAQRMNPLYVRRTVILVGLTMSAYFFVRP